jgi:esterase/lipase superfamily enzyme
LFCRTLPYHPGILERAILSALSIQILLLVWAGAGLAKGLSATAKYITIPIYYTTDRELKGGTFGNHRRYRSQCRHHMYYGTAMVTVPNKDNKIIDDRLKALGWKAAERHEAKICPKDMIDPSHPFKAKVAFNKRLIQALDDESKVALSAASATTNDSSAKALSRSNASSITTALSTSTSTATPTSNSTSNSTATSTPTSNCTATSTYTSAIAPSASAPPAEEPQLCLFVHGAADAFEDCAEDAATLAYYLEKPLVLYSWPSDPHLRGYFIDGSNIEWSQKHFQQFCRDLLELKSEHPMNVICLSHSMGNRLVIRALPVVYGKGLIADWEMISPDIDADTCRHYLMGFTQTKAKIRLYVSNKDLILPFTQMLNGGYYRLGEAANPAWEKNKKIRAEYLERIDFSLVDKGWHGHSLPFELVGNMVHSDKPPKGYVLVPETSVRANSLARFAGRSEDMSATSSEADFCSRLVKEKKPK